VRSTRRSLVNKVCLFFQLPLLHIDIVVPRPHVEPQAMIEVSIENLTLPEQHPNDAAILCDAYQMEFVVDNKILADEAAGVAIVTVEHRRGPIATLTQTMLSRGWWPREYHESLVVWRRRSWNTLADKLCNLAMDNGKNLKFISGAYSKYQIRLGMLLQCHSDGGMRANGIAAAAYTLTVLRLEDDGTLIRELLMAEAVFIDDVDGSSFTAERISLTMAMRAMHSFTNRSSEMLVNM